MAKVSIECKKYFFDTNIVVDFLGGRENFYEAAAKIMTLADKKKIKILTSSTSISNAFYVMPCNITVLLRQDVI